MTDSTGAASNEAAPTGGSAAGRSLAARWHRHRRLRLASLLGAPLAWLVVLYVGSLVALLVTSFFTVDSFTFQIVKVFSIDNFRELATTAVYRRVALRTIGVAALVTVACIALALPVAFFMAKVAKPRWRRALVTAVVIPLWASYLVKAFAWRLILDPADSVLKNTVGWAPGFNLGSVVIVMTYLWLPYMILPIYAGLERLPRSHLEASADLGARTGRTFRSVVVPAVFPAVAAGSIFTFSLTLGDYIAVGIVGGKTQMLGNVIYSSFGVPNVPLAAAFAFVPVVVMLGYLAAVRRAGAFENL